MTGIHHKYTSEAYVLGTSLTMGGMPHLGGAAASVQHGLAVVRPVLLRRHGQGRIHEFVARDADAEAVGRLEGAIFPDAGAVLGAGVGHARGRAFAAGGLPGRGEGGVCVRVWLCVFVRVCGCVDVRGAHR